MSARRATARDEADVIERLSSETEIRREDASLYLRLLKEGHLPAKEAAGASRLLEKGMAIISGDGTRIIPVHPRLGVANHYRTWREAMVREINEKRMRVDRLILELIPLYEAATDKRANGGGG